MILKLAFWFFRFFLDVLALLFLKGKPCGGVCVIRLDAIGDFVIWLDSAKEFRHIYPGKKITLVANAVWAELARQLPYWDEVWAIHPHKLNRNLAYRWSVLRRMRRGGFAVALQPTYSRCFADGDSLIRASGAPERIGSVGDGSNISYQAKKISNQWYTRLIPAGTQPLMELERNAEFIRHLTDRPYAAAMPVIPPNSQNSACVPAGDYFVLFPGASWGGRQWPFANFVQLAIELHGLHGWQLVLCGGEGDKPLCDRLAREVKVPSTNLVAKTSLAELAEVIRGARLLVANETSAIHFAAAVGVPAVCILGGGHYGRFMPYPDHLPGIKPLAADHRMPCFHCNWVCSQPHATGEAVPCVARISVGQVLQLAQQALTQS